MSHQVHCVRSKANKNNFHYEEVKASPNKD